MSKKKPGRKKPAPPTKPARQKKPEPQKKVQHQVLQPVRKTKPVPARAEDLHAADRREEEPQEELEQEQPAEELEQEQPAEELEQEQPAEELEQEEPAEELEQEQPAAISPLLLVAVNGTVADTSGNAWGYAVVQFSVFVQGGGRPIDLSTGLVIPTPAPIICDGSGNFSTTLQRTDTILPPGSMWNITIYPFNNQYDGQALTPFTMTAALNLSAMIAAQLAPHLDRPLIIPLSNSGTTGQPALNGSIYFDVETGTLYLRVPSSQGYVTLGFAGGAVSVSSLNCSGDANIDQVHIGANVVDLTRALVACFGANLVVEPPPGNGALQLCWSGGAGGVIFGDGASNRVASVDKTGSAVFNGNLQVGAGGNFLVNINTSQIDAWNMMTCHAGFDVAGGSKNFRIPHPTIADKDLIHACIEGPEAAVFYRGEGQTVNGRAQITLPDYFEALTMKGNRTVHLTIQVSDDDPVFGGAIAAGRVTDGGFKVYSTDPSTRFYWEVKAVRADMPRLQVVADKRQSERGA
jgi:hypothetical protein